MPTCSALSATERAQLMPDLLRMTRMEPFRAARPGASPAA